jgi:hypothetical protein
LQRVPSDYAAVFACLVGDEGLTEHLGCRVTNLGGRFAKMNAAFESVFKCPLSAAAGVNLGFDDEVLSVQGSSDFLGFLRRGGNSTGAVGDTEHVEEFFGLVFVDIHLADWKALRIATPELFRQ